MGGRTRFGCTLGLALVLVPLADAKERGPDAKQGYRDLVALTTPDGAPANPAAWPAALVEGRDWPGTPEQIAAWRAEGVRRLAAAHVLKVREVEDAALVRVRFADGEAEVPMRLADGRWVLAAPREYLVRGAALDAANGRAPATLRLTARSTSGAYGTSAFSFAHVTQDPQQCLNRMDVWYCHNGDLHASGGSQIVELGKGSLAKPPALPVRAAWQRTVAARKGFAYLLNARASGQRDFFVHLAVVAAGPEAVQIEWKLLSLGEGAPASIHEAQPWRPLDPHMGQPGANGCDGLCGRR